MSKMLEVSDLTMRFGGLVAVNKVALEIEEKQIVSIIGPNGAGKTTVFQLPDRILPSNGRHHPLCRRRDSGPAGA